MTNAEVIFGTAAWIETHLREELPIEAIAKKSGYSLHHFIRLFGGVIGVSPKEYVVRRKVSEAARELSTQRRRVPVHEPRKARRLRLLARSPDNPADH